MNKFVFNIRLSENLTVGPMIDNGQWVWSPNWGVAQHYLWGQESTIRNAPQKVFDWCFEASRRIMEHKVHHRLRLNWQDLYEASDHKYQKDLDHYMDPRSGGNHVPESSVYRLSEILPILIDQVRMQWHKRDLSSRREDVARFLEAQDQLDRRTAETRKHKREGEERQKRWEQLSEEYRHELPPAFHEFQGERDIHGTWVHIFNRDKIPNVAKFLEIEGEVCYSSWDIRDWYSYHGDRNFIGIVQQGVVDQYWSSDASTRQNSKGRRYATRPGKIYDQRHDEGTQVPGSLEPVAVIAGPDYPLRLAKKIANDVGLPLVVLTASTSDVDEEDDDLWEDWYDSLYE